MRQRALDREAIMARTPISSWFWNDNVTCHAKGCSEHLFGKPAQEDFLNAE